MTDTQNQLNEIAELLIKNDVNAALKKVYELMVFLKQQSGEVNESEERKESGCEGS